MAGLVGTAGACDVVIYKDGLTITRENFPVLFNSIAKVSAKVRVAQMAEVKIELTPSFEDALTILASGLLGSSTGAAGQVPELDGAKTAPSPSSIGAAAAPSSSDQPQIAPSNAPYVAVKFYYPDDEDSSTDWYGGFAVVPDLSLNSGEITITINVIGQHSLMSMSQGPKVFKNEPAIDVIKKLASTFGCEIVFEDGDTETEAILTAAKVNGQFNENSESLLRRILDKYRCQYVKDTGGADSKARYVVKSIKYLHEQEVQYHFVAFRQVEPEKNVYPVFSFELISKGTLFFPSHTFGTVSRAVLSTTKEIKKFVGTADAIEAKATGGVKAEGLAFPTSTGAGADKGGAVGKVDTSDPDETGADAPAVGNKESDTTEVLNSRAEIARNEMLEYRMTVMGLPKIQPQTMVQVTIGPGEKGVEAFSGPCAIKSVEHIWDVGGWVSDLEVRKTGGATSLAGTKEKESQAPTAPDNKVTKTPTGITS